MGDLSITATTVTAGTNSVQETFKALAAITAGQVLYKDSTGKRVGLADANDLSATIRKPVGIALHAASAGQPIRVHKQGRINIGAVVAVGTPYFLSSNPGMIGLASDLTSGKYTAYLGTAVATTTIDVQIHDSGAQVP